MSNERAVIHSQLIATQHQNLLLPNTAIAEIVRYTAPQPIDNAPDWLLGTLVWRGLRVPVVSYELASGEPAKDYDGSARIAVLNGVHSGASLQFYAVVIRNNPRLIKVSRDDIRKESGGDREKFQVQQVIVNNLTAIIPDLAALEQLITGAGIQTERVH
ncbi:MAG: chemotaxis protein CheW [Gammaproteobacteria bacterium]|nr:chemotaxis protein CheW [Gammaproteobacteria bacterium]